MNPFNESFYIVKSGHSLRKFSKSRLRQVYLVDKKTGMQQANLLKKHLAYLSLNLLIQELCGLELSTILFKIKMASEQIIYL